MSSLPNPSSPSKWDVSGLFGARKTPRRCQEVCTVGYQGKHPHQPVKPLCHHLPPPKTQANTTTTASCTTTDEGWQPSCEWHRTAVMTTTTPATHHYEHLFVWWIAGANGHNTTRNWPQRGYVNRDGIGRAEKGCEGETQGMMAPAPTTVSHCSQGGFVGAMATSSPDDDGNDPPRLLPLVPPLWPTMDDPGWQQWEPPAPRHWCKQSRMPFLTPPHPLYAAPASQIVSNSSLLCSRGFWWIKGSWEGHGGVWWDPYTAGVPCSIGAVITVVITCTHRCGVLMGAVYASTGVG